MSARIFALSDSFGPVVGVERSYDVNGHAQYRAHCYECHRSHRAVTASEAKGVARGHFDRWHGDDRG